MSPIEDLTNRLITFRDERDWRQFHSLKDLILSLNLEAAEMLELAQWKSEAALDDELADPEFKQKLADETADVFLYVLLICERAGIDLGEAARAKIEKNAQKYPVDKAKGNAKKYTEL